MIGTATSSDLASRPTGWQPPVAFACRHRSARRNGFLASSYPTREVIDEVDAVVPGGDRCGRCSRGAGACARRCRDRLERDRADRDRRDGRPVAAGGGSELRDGAGCRLRRGERDRRAVPAVSRAAGRKSVGLQGSCDRGGCVQRAQGVVPRASRGAEDDLRQLRRRSIGYARRVEGRRHRRRRGHGGRDAGGAAERRSQPAGPVPVLLRDPARGVAPGASAGPRPGNRRDRPGALGERRAAVHRPGRDDAPH